MSIISTISNPVAAELAQALADAVSPTPSERLLAMALIYSHGKTDGAVEALTWLEQNFKGNSDAIRTS